MSTQSPLFVVASPGAGAAVLFELLAGARETVRLPRDVPPNADAPTLHALFRAATRGTQKTVVASLMRQRLSIATARATWPNARFIYLYREAAAHIDAAPRVASSAAAWEAETRTILCDLGGLPSDAWCGVNYDDLLADPDAEARWLGQFLGLTWSAQVVAAGPALQRHRRAASLAAPRPRVPAHVISLALRAEGLQRKHHPAWLAEDAARARRHFVRNPAMQRFQRAVVSGRVAAGVCLASALPSVARAATYQVVNLGDSGAGSLRDAIAQANANSGADTITFGSGASGEIELKTGALRITDSVNIEGPGSSVLYVDGQNASPVFYPYSKGNVIDVTISGLTAENGNNANPGGAIASRNTNLTISDCVVQNSNSASSGGGIAAIIAGAANANATLINTVVKGNNAAGDGGGVALGNASDRT